MKIIHLLFLLMTCFVMSCKKDPATAIVPAVTQGSLKLVFDNVVGTSDLKLNADKYLNAHGDTFSVSLFKYYISNVRLRRQADQVWVAFASNNHLIEEGGKDNFTLSNIPATPYDMLEFKVGLDSATNFGTNFNEDLNKSKGMYWEWDPQYVFLKLEGKRYYNATNEALVFHIADNANLKTIQLPFKQTWYSGQTLVLQIKTDILKMFESPNQTDFTKVNNVMMGAEAANIASNYSNMFTLTASKIE